MALPQFSMRELIEAGVHFGHKTKRWNPRMAPYLYGVRNDVHIIDLQQTVPMLHAALANVREVVAKNGRVLFVGTKHQAAEAVAEAAARCGQYYVNHRWLGGMLTNWGTIQNSIKTLRKLEEMLENPPPGLTKKELLTQEREKAKLDRALGGIKDMGGLPNLILIIDTLKEELAIKEAARLGIPVVAIVDSNSSLDGVTHPIPGNDDATRAIKLYCRLFSDAALDGLQESMTASGADLGASAEVPFTAEKEEKHDKKPAREDNKKGKIEKKAPAVVTKTSKLKAEETPFDLATASQEAAEEETPKSKKPSKKKA